MSKSAPLVFFGTEDFSAASLRALIEKGWPIALVVTKPDFKRGRGQEMAVPAAKKIAQQHNIRVCQPANMADVTDDIKAVGADYGILVAYGKIIPRSVINSFPGGIINLHPSLLPKYRGPAPIEAAILNGDKQTGLSLMRLSAEMDAGPLYAQQPFKLSGTENRLSLYADLAEAGANFLVDKLPQVIDGSLKPTPQDDAQATYTKLLSKQDGLIDQSKPAEQIEREIRAYKGYPKSRARIFGEDVIITKAKLARGPAEDGLVLACQPGYLEVQELIAPSGRTMSGADFIRGYRKV